MLTKLNYELYSHKGQIANKYRRDIRQVPDNQEVYLDANGFASITIDIMERVDANDEKALETHLADVMGAPGEVKTFEEWQPMTWDKMP